MISQSPKIEEVEINEDAIEQTTSEQTSVVAETPKRERNKRVKRTELFGRRRVVIIIISVKIERL